MPTAFDYFEMARECLNEAEATKDTDRKKCLHSIAKLYTQTALGMESVGAQDNAPLARKAG